MNNAAMILIKTAMKLRRNVLEGKGTISHEQAVEKANKEYEVFRVRQDLEYMSQFDKAVEKYIKGE